ncbi:hypothetical protein [Adhaeribacter aquaticus]|uniref:hypothetical protein n=1 Tax=Adhaeribacter aquaticus TaxID=299567 RepID=UPI00041BAF05|nr:hypothetical protein [Adhaeribacter aquaticus]
MKALALSILFFLILIFSLKAQQPGTSGAPTVPQTLQQQFNTIKNRSAFQPESRDFKIVRITRLDNFWQNVQDSLKVRESKIRQAGKSTAQALQNANTRIATLENELEALKQENAQKEQQIQKTAHDVASLSFLGIAINKQLYVVLSCIVILGLIVLAAVFAYLYKNSQQITDEKIKSYEEISQEYKEHKQHARERETKIKRDLQTEVNKVDELKQEIANLKKQIS